LKYKYNITMEFKPILKFQKKSDYGENNIYLRHVTCPIGHKLINTFYLFYRILIGKCGYLRGVLYI